MELAPEDRISERGDTRFRDYILSDYDPVCAPEGRLRAESLYRWALRRGGILGRTWPAVEAVRAHLGRDLSVWGLKWGPRGFTSELYFYNNANNPPGHVMQATTLGAVLAPWLSFDSSIDEALPYFMCSVDLDAPTLASENVGWHLYLGSGDRSRTQCGFSYLVHGTEHTLENHYWFYDPRRELEDLKARVATSPRTRTSPFETLLPDYLLDCHTVCIAVKPRHDCLYFSRLTSAQLRRFLAEYPTDDLPDLAALIAVMDHHADDLAHLRWDVGVDITVDRDGVERRDKVGVYGVL